VGAGGVVSCADCRAPSQAAGGCGSGCRNAQCGMASGGRMNLLSWKFISSVITAKRSRVASDPLGWPVNANAAADFRQLRACWRCRRWSTFHHATLDPGNGQV
jgi:hypothetical protein